MGLVCVLWVGMTFMDVALLKCELHCWRFIWGRVFVVCGWCMAFCVISLRVFSILICVGGK